MSIVTDLRQRTLVGPVTDALRATGIEPLVHLGQNDESGVKLTSAEAARRLGGALIDLAALAEK